MNATWLIEDKSRESQAGWGRNELTFHEVQETTRMHRRCAQSYAGAPSSSSVCISPNFFNL